MWRFNTYAGNWRVPALQYRDWMEHAFDAKRLSEKATWLEDVTLFVGNTGSAAVLTRTDFLDALATKADPAKTVVLLDSWAAAQEWSRDYDDYEPIYEPLPELRNFLEVAKRHGFRVLLYTFMRSFSPAHPLYPEFIQYQHRDPWTGELQGWRNSIGELRNAQMNHASSAFRAIFVNELKDVWDMHDIDGFLLDSSFATINDANGLIDGLNSAQGTALLHEELAEAMPGAIFAGERLHEGTFALESFAIQPIFAEEKREPHPISSFLFSPFTHAISSARTNPDREPIRHQIEHQKVLDYSGVWGIIPTLYAWEATHLLNSEEYPSFQQILALTGDYEHRYGLNGDVNNDGQVNILDLILVAQNFGAIPLRHLQADVNGDGVVNVLDLISVAEQLSQNAAAPSQMNPIKSIPSNSKEIIAARHALIELETIPNKSLPIQLAIELLQHYLSIADQYVQKPKLLPNYPNPFNPETWIPYQLSEESTATVRMYDVGGHLVRTIEVGLKPTGYYLTRERAVYWDGRNESGEPVSSGVYFYTFTAGDYIQTRRMVIVK